MTSRTTKVSRWAIAALLCLNLLAQFGFGRNVATQPAVHEDGSNRYSVCMAETGSPYYTAILVDGFTGKVWMTNGNHPWEQFNRGGPADTGKSK